MSERVLVVAHNHPAFHPGGTEIVAHDLFQAYKRAGWKAMFLAATNQVHREQRPGTNLQAVGDAPDEVVLWAGHFDRLMMSQVDLHGVVPDLVRLLEDFRPDVVEIHHLLLLGIEFPALVRRVLPNARIVMMLHDYYPICAHEGLMVRRHDKARCLTPSADNCHACFPETSAATFLLRKLNIQTHMETIDAFISPSHFLKERFVEWGLAADRIADIANGHPAGQPAPEREAHGEPRNVFGYFGNLNRWKGVLPLLEACRILADEGVEFEMRVHGAPLFQSPEFLADLDAGFAAAQGAVRRMGQYARGDIPDLMAGLDWVVVPSVWWENAPLTISEAQFHRRPVVASGIGGMAELVRNGENGLTVRPDDPSDLARTMARAVEDIGLWRRLAAGTVPPPSIEVTASRHIALFNGTTAAEPSLVVAA
jgi:glycosyltransferase involved in cell wall biosynthesis